jgi:hypothetical protein
MKSPRFTLRELFLIVVVAAMGCGWWVERHRKAEMDDVTEFIQSMLDGQGQHVELHCQIRNYSVSLAMDPAVRPRQRPLVHAHEPV